MRQKLFDIIPKNDRHNFSVNYLLTEMTERDNESIEAKIDTQTQKADCSFQQNNNYYCYKGMKAISQFLSEI